MAKPKVTIQTTAAIEMAATAIDMRQFRSLDNMMMKDPRRASVARNMSRKTALPLNSMSWKRMLNGCFGKHYHKDAVLSR